MERVRCDWVLNAPLSIEYHDREWGRPVYDDQKLFEFLILEGAQAGLSWMTILKRRENYREAFDGFNPEKVSQYDAYKVEVLLQDEGIIRNRRKIESAIQNAGAFLRVQEEFGSFSTYIWQFVGGEPIVNHWKRSEDIPTQTETSVKISKNLKKRGFSFVGPTIMYAYMQAVGMVDDHLDSCFLGGGKSG
jgi:DNA-3-methyladenine glycosylase I